MNKNQSLISRDNEIEENALEIIKNRELNIIITNITENLQASGEHLVKLKEINKELEELQGRINSLEITKEKIANINFMLFQRDITKVERAKVAFTLSCIYVALARFFIKKNNPPAAWSAIAKAQYYCGLVEGLTDFLSRAKGERSQKANTAKDGYKKEFKNNIIKLITTEKPKSGWSNPSKAAHAIVNSLREMTTDKSALRKLSQDDLIGKITNIIFDDPEVKMIFENTKRN